MAENKGKGDDKGQHPPINLGNVLIAGEDVLLHYQLTKLILRFATQNEVMSHKLIGLLEAVKHGLLTYTDMICVTSDMEEADGGNDG